jgi:hypothetical protein
MLCAFRADFLFKWSKDAQKNGPKTEMTEATEKRQKNGNLCHEGLFGP